VASLRFRDLANLPRLTNAYLKFLRRPITAAQADGIIHQRLATREERFIQIVKLAIYEHPASPYLPLLRAAGCDFGDLKALVIKEGLEGTLSRLVEAGVYVTFDEFKGRKEAVRGSQRFAVAESDFNNPRISPDFEVRSGGTRSPGTRVGMELPFVAELAAGTGVALQAHGISDYDHAVWLYSGVGPLLIYAKLGRPPLAWFYPVEPLPLRVRARARYVGVLSRLTAAPLPRPTFLALQEPGRMADWLDTRLKEGKTVCITTYASSAVRICVAAREMGLNLNGVWFITLGEPYTDAKKQTVEAVGARTLVRYAFTEAGIIGYLCAEPHASDDLHAFTDCYGLIQRSRAVGDSGPSVDAFLFTSLLPSAPKILLNVESGDYGVMERRRCGCLLGAAGLTTHLSRIRSFEKLSGEGLTWLTFVQTDLLRLLEEVLPARFGGTSADYQAIEEEGDHGILRLLLIVSPRVGPVDEDSVRETFLQGLGRDGKAWHAYAEMWRRAGTVHVKRQWPIPTKAGKILPFHLVKA
jgi:hypothetical protein